MYFFKNVLSLVCMIKIHIYFALNEIFIIYICIRIQRFPDPDSPQCTVYTARKIPALWPPLILSWRQRAQCSWAPCRFLGGSLRTCWSCAAAGASRGVGHGLRAVSAGHTRGWPPHGKGWSSPARNLGT